MSSCLKYDFTTSPACPGRHGLFEFHNQVNMNTEIIASTTRATLAGTISFPDVVAALMATGVEYYHVEYAALSMTFYSGSGDVVVMAIPYEGLPSIDTDFQTDLLKATILDSQRHGQKFRDFTHRAMSAGVQSYAVFLRGQRVTYWGRTGDQHTEWFPGATPARVEAK